MYLIYFGFFYHFWNFALDCLLFCSQKSYVSVADSVVVLLMGSISVCAIDSIVFHSKRAKATSAKRPGNNAEAIRMIH